MTTSDPHPRFTEIVPPERMVEVLTSAVQECGEIIRQKDEALAAANQRIADMEAKLAEMRQEPTPHEVMTCLSVFRQSDGLIGKPMNAALSAFLAARVRT